MSIARRTTITCALAAVAFGATGCGDSGDVATTVVERATVTRTVTVQDRPTTPAQPPQTTPAATPPLTLRAAEQVLDGRGYATLAERDWRPDQNLKVLLGVRRGVSDAGAQQAFFFVGDAFIGTDTSDPSGRITVTAQSDDAVTLAYGLYRPGDSIESPSGGESEVTYAWDGDSLSPQEPIPPSAADAALSRR